MDTSIFMDLNKKPKTDDLKVPLEKTYEFWLQIRDFVFERYPLAIEEWHVSVKKYGWGFRIKDKKRAIIYLSPRSGYFFVTFVFGQKATDQILASDVSKSIKAELIDSKVYMEGRVIRLEIKDNSFLEDIKRLIEIKITN
ncbi:MAG TPA: DUF3788 family protein [Draconibacterium sp.]|nr:DUF3788 family protein [Draconibacterium sp.]